MRSTQSKVLKFSEAVAQVPTPDGIPFAGLFNHGSLEVEIFSPQERDTQQPHARDEVYVVVTGSAEFVHGEQRDAVAPGDFLFVPAGMVHCFENFSADLCVWVLFYGPEGGEAP